MPRLVIATHRRLDTERSGSKTYLKRMIALAEAAGFETAIVLAPGATFSNRPWTHMASDFSVGRQVSWPGTVRIAGHVWSRSPAVWGRFGWRVMQEAIRRAGLGPESLRKPWSNLSSPPPDRELDRMARAVMALQPDAVMVEYSSLGPLLARLPGRLGKALLVHDSFAARAELFAQRGETPDYSRMPDFDEEAARMSEADLVFHASVNELERFQPLSPKARHVWFRPAAPVRRDALARLEAARLTYVGANQSGSRDAISHFLEEVWPLVRARAPGARIEIIGPVGAAVPTALIGDGVDVLGMVDDLADHAGPDRIGIAPTRLASGISIKVGEYLGLGLPVVAYRTGVDGYGGALDEVISLAESPEAFARDVVRLLEDRDLRQARAEAGLDAAEAVLRNDEVTEALKTLVSPASAVRGTARARPD